MAAKHNKKHPKEGKFSSTDKPPSKKSTPSGSGFDYAALLEKLKAVKWLEGECKPADVEALKAKLDGNPNGEKPKAFICHHDLCFLCRKSGHKSSNWPRKSFAGAGRQ